MRDMSSLRVFVGMYGLNRSLAWTRRSIAANVLRPLRATGMNVRFAAHFNMVDVIRNIHSQEDGARGQGSSWRKLPIDALLTEPQGIARLPAKARQWTDPRFPDDTAEACQTRANLMFQLYSLRRLWDLAGLMGAHDADIIVFIRPDLEYLDAIDAPRLVEQIVDGGTDLITANWHRWGGLNDRFAYCSPRGAEVYATRLDRIDDFCRRHGALQAEALLAECATAEGLRLGETGVRAMRVRSNGATWREDFTLTPGQMLRSVARKRLVRLGLPAF